MPLLGVRPCSRRAVLPASNPRSPARPWRESYIKPLSASVGVRRKLTIRGYWPGLALPCLASRIERPRLLAVRVRYTRVPARKRSRSRAHTRKALHSVSSRVLFQYGGCEGGERYGGGCRATCREGAEL